MPQPDLCVIFNPAAGRGQAARRLAKLGQLWGPRALFQPTGHAGHAFDLAHRAARSDFRIVAAAGGDGTVHEVANGLLRAGRPEVRFAVVPPQIDAAVVLNVGWVEPQFSQALINMADAIAQTLEIKLLDA